jgi:hypothetical protein
MDWIDVDQGREKWQALLDAVFVPQTAENLTS